MSSPTKQAQQVEYTPGPAFFPSFTMGPKAVQAYLTWHPDREEVSAASDYALDSMARSTGKTWDFPADFVRRPEDIAYLNWLNHADWLANHLA